MDEEEILYCEEGGTTVRVSFLRGNGQFATYPLKPTQWRRAMRFVERYGVRRSLVLMDARAEAAIERGDMSTCLVWRDLMVAVHAFSSDKPRRGEVAN